MSDVFMKRALALAKEAAQQGEVPVGAVLVLEGQILAESCNLVETRPDPTAHAEILCLQEGARKLESSRLIGCTLYVTLEPCAMCAQAIAFARLKKLVFGAYDPKGGGVEHGAKIFSRRTCHHQPEIIGGVLEKECGTLLKAFFQAHR